MAQRAWSGILVVLVGACGGGGTEPATPDKTSGSESTAPAGEQQVGPKVDVEAMFARESEPAALQELSAPDGSIKGRVETTAAPVVTMHEKFVQIVTQVAEFPLQCFVYPEAKDGAEVARVLIAGTLDEAIPADDRRWVDVHGDQADGWPYVIARAHYLKDTEAGRLAGDFKVAVSVRDETTVACLMDAPGYYASFERALRSLLSGLDSAPRRGIAKPSYAEITRIALPGRLVTVSRKIFERDKKQLISRDWNMELMITPTGALQTTDEASSEVMRGGRVVNGSYGKGAMGQAELAMTLAAEGDRHTVSGTVQDKPITGEFTVKGGLPDEVRAKATLCKVRDGKQASAELVSYEPGVDPLRTSVVKIAKSPTPDAQLLVTVGDNAIEMKVMLDEDCDIDRGTVVAGPVSLSIERLWHEGQAP
jgi:hypothetical protein